MTVRRGRARPSVLGMLVLLIVVAAADPVAETADKVVAALAAGDPAALKALAGQRDPDPWLVADELLERNDADAATAFARATGAARLADYAVRGRESRPADRKAFARARSLFEAGDAKRAHAVLAAMSVEPSDVLSVRILSARAAALRDERYWRECSDACLAAAAKAERLGWVERAARFFNRAGLVAYRHSDWDRAGTAWRRMVALEETRVPGPGLSLALSNLGLVSMKRARYDEAYDLQRRALAIADRIGDTALRARALASLGLLDDFTGKYASALARYGEVARLAEQLDDVPMRARNLGNMGVVYSILGRHEEALSHHRQSLALSVATGDRRAQGESHGNLAIEYAHLGAHRQALDHGRRALELAGDDPAGKAASLGTLAAIHQGMGEPARALGYHEQSLALAREVGWPIQEATTLLNISAVHAELDDIDRALAYGREALALNEKIGNRPAIAAILGNLGTLHTARKEYDRARAYHMRSLEILRALGDRAGEASVFTALGNIATYQEQYDRAIEYRRLALRLHEEAGDRAGVANALANFGVTHLHREEIAQAVAYHRRALVLAEDLDQPQLLFPVLRGLARSLYRAGERGEALRFARRAVAELERFTAGLADVQGAIARESALALFEVGVQAALDEGDLDALCFFVERGRARTFTETLRVRAAVGATVPEELRTDERAARFRVAALRRERGADPKHREELAAAEARWGDTVARIQREAKLAADIVYPKTATLAELRGGLARGDALVLYSLVAQDAIALVVERTSARVVKLGPANALADAARSLVCHDPGMDPSAPAEHLRRRIVAPLGLNPETRRLFVSPDGPLSYLPFALLDDRRLAYVPSGTTYGALRGQAATRGEAVLALGDPAYARAREGASAFRGGDVLARLPASGAEARAVGDTVLLGREATVGRLAATLRTREHWLAVHLACHARVDPARPMLSFLALAPDGSSDGRLTTLDILRTRIPADLVVLSACETARGQVYLAEGVVGFTRAFMLAGAPRVIVSLWKVDDEATRALMEKFYELWNPASAEATAGRPGRIATAKALRMAQEHVRAEQKWRHPYYWAAWQLWGLAD